MVGSDNEQIGKMLADLYSTITDEGCQYVGRIEVAETPKMVENVQRDIDIALSNGLAIVLSQIGVDVEKFLLLPIQNAITTDIPWDWSRGHCIPVDPYYYIYIQASRPYSSYQ